MLTRAGVHITGDMETQALSGSRSNIQWSYIKTLQYQVKIKVKDYKYFGQTISKLSNSLWRIKKTKH